VMDLLNRLEPWKEVVGKNVTIKWTGGFEDTYLLEYVDAVTRTLFLRSRELIIAPLEHIVAIKLFK